MSASVDDLIQGEQKTLIFFFLIGKTYNFKTTIHTINYLYCAQQMYKINRLQQKLFESLINKFSNNININSS